MRRGIWLCVLLLAAGAICSSAAFADLPEVRGWVGAYGGHNNGGEFDVNADGWDGLPGYWTAVGTSGSHVYGATTYQTQFATFCVQRQQYFNPGVAYDVNLATFTDGDPNYSMDLTNEAAWLFAQWNAHDPGNLLGYRYGAGRQSDAGDLQEAIWAHMNEMQPASLSVQATKWYNLAVGKWSSIDGVRVMQLYDEASGDHQDWLVQIGAPSSLVPEPGSFALLVVGALGLLPVLRRRNVTVAFPHVGCPKAVAGAKR